MTGPLFDIVVVTLVYVSYRMRPVVVGMTSLGSGSEGHEMDG